MAKCDRCGGETKQKRLTSKNTGKEYVILECISGCRNREKPQFPYSFFPPREKPLKAPLSKIVNETGKKSDLNEIKRMLLKLLTVNGIDTTEFELEPDEKVPF